MSCGLHLGCGPIKIESTPEMIWVNVDKEEASAANVVMDVCDYLALTGPIADVIWSCHMLEHLPYPAGVTWFLRACREALKPGGILRLAVPDLETATYLYETGQTEKLYGKDFKGFYHKDCDAERFHFFMHAWEHTMVFDFDLLFALLKEAGFSDIRKCVFGESAIPDWHYDRFESESLYVEAVK